MFTQYKKTILGVMLLVVSFFILGMASPVPVDSETISNRSYHSLNESDYSVQSLAVSGTAVSGTAIAENLVPLNKKPTLAEIYSNIKIKKVSLKMYAKKKLTVKLYPTKKAKTIKKIDKYSEVRVKGKIKKKSLGSKYVLIKYGKKGKKSKKGYVLWKKLSKSNPDFLYRWKGSKLTRSKGVNAGPSGKETYYNLPMGGVIRIMRAHGYRQRYWVRKDGCKMLGNYIMVAADQRIRPLGSHVKTSLGMGIVCDTGSFIYSNSHQLDIAVAW